MMKNLLLDPQNRKIHPDIRTLPVFANIAIVHVTVVLKVKLEVLLTWNEGELGAKHVSAHSDEMWRFGLKNRQAGVILLDLLRYTVGTLGGADEDQVEAEECPASTQIFH